MPSMQRLYTMLPKDKFKMLAILNKDEPALADKFAAQFGITMPILDDQANKVGPTYGLTGLPETFIVDKEGILREKFIGPVQWDTIAIQQMLAKYINQ
jgi:peroxiredoxin